MREVVLWTAVLLSAAVLAPAQKPVIVSLDSTWSGVDTGYEVVSFDAPVDYETIASALRDRGVPEGRAMLWSSSSSVSTLVARDAQAARFFGLVVSGADSEADPSVASGEFGYNALSGTYWLMPVDPGWIARFGGIVEQLETDRDLRQTALDRFASAVELRNYALPSRTTWQVRRDPDFQIHPAGTPNAGLVNGQVWLSVSGQRLFRDGVEEPLDLSAAFEGTGYVPAEVIPRQGPVWFALGIVPPGTTPRSGVFRVVEQKAELAFEGPDEQGRLPGAPEVVHLTDGRTRLYYEARTATPSNIRTAISTDGGRTFTPEFPNPFGDLATPEAGAADLNHAPAVLRLRRDGGFLAVTVRDSKLHFFSSLDGRTFVPTGQAPVGPGELYPEATALFDPTLVQTGDGRVWLYVTAATGTTEADSRVVRAELIPNL